MSQAELLHWCSAYQAVPATDEESEIVAQFLAAPYPYQNDDDQDQKQLGGIRASSGTYWPDHVTYPSAGAGAGVGYWSCNGDSSSNSSGGGGGGGGYFDDGGCYYYLGQPDVSLGINARTLPCTSIDLNLLGDGEDERSTCIHPVPPPKPSPAQHIHSNYLNAGNDGAAASQTQPRRKVQAGREGGDLGRHKKKARASEKQEKKVAPKTLQKCGQENMQSSSSCSGNESNCTEVNHRPEAHVGDGNVKTRAGKGSATDPQSLYARRRRERINERLKILQQLVPNGTKVDISTMLEEAVHYVRFLQLQIKMLSSDETWMYAPIAYNGMSLGLDLKISPPQ